MTMREPAGLHPLLQRQLERARISADAGLLTLLQAVSEHYVQQDEDRELLEHTLEEMSQEMTAINRNLRQELKERQQAERQLLQSRANLARAQRIARLGSFEYNLETLTLSLSEETLNILGDSIRQIASQEDVMRLVYEADRAMVLRAIASSMESSEPFNIDCRVLLPQRGLLFLNCQAELQREVDGSPRRVFGTVHDITERKQVAALLEESNRRLEQGLAAVELLNREMGLLSDLSAALQRCQELNEAVNVMRDYLPRLFPAVSGVLFLDRRQRGSYARVASWGQVPINTLDHFNRTGCLALQRQHAHLFSFGSGQAACQHVLNEDDHRIMCMCVPLQAQEQQIGVLHLQKNGQDPACLVEMQTLAQAVCEQAALALSNLQLRTRLHQQSIRDALTGLYNRRQLDASLAEIFRQNSWWPLALVILDIDHFKQLNDTRGHDAGDSALRQLARLLREQIRPQDSAYRLGGEEFVLLMPFMTDVAAFSLCETILEEIRNHPFHHQQQTLGRITASIGIAVAGNDGTGPERLLKIADMALYQAKQSGRDRVVLLGSET